MMSTAAILATAMFVGDCTTASTSLAGAAAVFADISFNHLCQGEGNYPEWKFHSFMGN